ncbi:endonuclease [Tamaricihabitans halophyticus]|nr:endonuclease [Tamaricihabitans halophyticus]
MANADQSTLVRDLLATAGRSYAAEAGIELTDKPAPLYQTMVLSLLLSTRIKASIAVAATHELVRSGLGTARKMRAASWQERVAALGRAHYVRYDESTATALGRGAQLLLDDYGGDPRRLRARAAGEPARVRELLRAFPRIGPVGADIFCREVQSIWPELRPYLDVKALDGARLLGLPTDAATLAPLVPGEDLARFAAALVRVALDKKLAGTLRQSNG